MAPSLEPLPGRSCSSIGLRISFNSASGFPSPLPVTFYARPKSPRAGKPQSSPKQPHVGYFRTMKWMLWRHARPRELGFLQVSANSKAEDPLPSEMSLENALQILGVAEGASFEEILRAKNSLLGKHGGDQEVAVQPSDSEQESNPSPLPAKRKHNGYKPADRAQSVETAYDVLLMQSLTQRRSGKVVDSSIRYADVKKAMTSSGMGGPQWFKEALSKVPVAVETPPPSTIGTQTAVYAGLVVWTFANGLSSQPSLSANSDVPGVILAIGFGASLYFLRKQNVKLGKAVVLAVAGLVAGSVFGGAVESWLRVDVIPVFGIGSPAVVVSEFVLVSLWLTSLYLR